MQGQNRDISQSINKTDKGQAKKQNPSQTGRVETGKSGKSGILEYWIAWRSTREHLAGNKGERAGIYIEGLMRKSASGEEMCGEKTRWGEWADCRAEVSGWIWNDTRELLVCMKTRPDERNNPRVSDIHATGFWASCSRMPTGRLWTLGFKPRTFWLDSQPFWSCDAVFRCENVLVHVSQSTPVNLLVTHQLVAMNHHIHHHYTITLQ